MFVVSLCRRVRRDEAISYLEKERKKERERVSTDEHLDFDIEGEKDEGSKKESRKG